MYEMRRFCSTKTYNVLAIVFRRFNDRYPITRSSRGGQCLKLLNIHLILKQHQKRFLSKT